MANFNVIDYLQLSNSLNSKHSSAAQTTVMCCATAAPAGDSVELHEVAL